MLKYFIRDAFDLRREHQVALVAMTPGGTCAAGALRPGYKSVVTDADGTRVIEPDLVLIET